MQGVVFLLLPCQTLFSAGLANIADDSRTASSYSVCLGWSIETFKDRFTAVLPGYGPEIAT